MQTGKINPIASKARHNKIIVHGSIDCTYILYVLFMIHIGHFQYIKLFYNEL